MSSVGKSVASHQKQSTDRAGLKGKAGATKKGGGGGGFTWGRPGDEINAPAVLNRKDPNYDSEQEDEQVVFESTQAGQELAARRAGVSISIPAGSNNTKNDALLMSPPRHNYNPLHHREVPKTPLPLFKSSVARIIDEYFTNEDVDEFTSEVLALDSPILHYELVRRLVQISMERNDRERELTSQMLCKLRADGLLTIEQCGKGFERLFELIDDLVLDVPHAKKFVAQFLARAIVDEVLPPSFLSDPLVESLGGEVVEQAKILLSIKHGVVRLERVWGATEGSSVKDLKREVRMVLLEYLSSSDLDEACECIKRLNVSHFHHEVIKRAVVIAMDKHLRERAMMSSLLAELVSREIVSSKQLEIGFDRLAQAASDLELDTPGAREILKVFINQAVDDNCLDKETAKNIIKNIS